MGLDGLQRAVLDDFSAGAELNVAPHLIDPRGLGGCAEGLYNDDGSVYLRGGSKWKSSPTFGVFAAQWGQVQWGQFQWSSELPPPFGTSIRSAWDGWFAVGHRTLLRTPISNGVLDPADDATPIDLGGYGTMVPHVNRLVNGLLFIAGGQIYAGSLQAADPTPAGTVTVVRGAKGVVGVGTTWTTAGIDAGMLFRTGTEERVYVVATVDDDTHLTLTEAYEGTPSTVAASQAFTLKRLETASKPYRSAMVYGSIAERLIVIEENAIIRFSERSKPHSFIDTDFHQLDDGVEIITVEALGTDLVVFTTQGYWLIRNMAFNLTDALGALQQREDHPNRELVCWGGQGITDYRGALVVPALDGIMLVDGISQPVPISKGIEPRYRRHVDLGHRPGKAEVYRDHYLLPITDVAGKWQDTLVCRLDRPVKTRSQTLFPWSWHEGAGAQTAFYVERVPRAEGSRPELLGGDLQAGRVLDCSDYFSPAVATKFDHDGSERMLELVTRDLPTGPAESINRVRRVRLIGELEADEGDTPTISMWIRADVDDGDARWGEVIWGDFQWADGAETQFVLLGDVATEADLDGGRGGKDFFSNVRTRYARVRLRSSGPIAKLTIRSLEVWSAAGGRVRHSKVEKVAA